MSATFEHAAFFLEEDLETVNPHEPRAPRTRSHASTIIPHRAIPERTVEGVLNISTAACEPRLQLAMHTQEHFQISRTRAYVQRMRL